MGNNWRHLDPMNSLFSLIYTSGGNVTMIEISAEDNRNDGSVSDHEQSSTVTTKNETKPNNSAIFLLYNRYSNEPEYSWVLIEQHARGVQKLKRFKCKLSGSTEPFKILGTVYGTSDANLQNTISLLTLAFHSTTHLLPIKQQNI